jgi:hypothetical protein
MKCFQFIDAELNPHPPAVISERKSRFVRASDVDAPVNLIFQHPVAENDPIFSCLIEIIEYFGAVV